MHIERLYCIVGGDYILTGGTIYFWSEIFGPMGDIIFHGDSIVHCLAQFCPGDHIFGPSLKWSG